jgi:aconitate decarboxylase
LACQSGVRGAILASEGFTGIADVLEADFGGFCSTMGGGQVNLAALTSGLGTRWETDQIGFKPYASCAAAQSSIEVVRQIREELGAGASARSVTVHSSTHAKMHCGWEYQGGGVTAAQMNIPYGVACMLVHGDVSADRFCDQ